MATASDVPGFSAPARISSVIVLERLEGLAVAAVTAVLYARTGASWWLFAAFWLLPDLSMLGYLRSPCTGARVYNAFHNYVPPATLGVFGLLHTGALLPAIALIWANHIGVDRALGYGLKYAQGFAWTHLGQLGKRRAA
jgi:Domain of unknown function (DUF4260)